METLVHVENVGKLFCRDFKRSLWYGLRDSVHDLFFARRDSQGQNQESRYRLERELRPGEFWANRAISFTVARGDCFGLIGRNGAGKTTLLKMLNGLIKPDEGQITMRGKVGAMIALGAGFNPILTGRENVYVNGAILGLAKDEIEDVMEEVIDFSEIRDFIDSPVRTYSSGMQVRLGFAVATALKPDILLLDEVLAVGDSRFRQKCLNRVKQLRSTCATIFVSHQEADVRRIADRGILLDKGNPVACGTMDEIFSHYHSLMETDDSRARGNSNFAGEIEVLQIQYAKEEILFGDTLDCHARIRSRCELRNCVVRVVILDSSGAGIAEWDSRLRNIGFDFSVGEQSFHVSIPNVRIRSGRFQTAIEISSVDGKIYAKQRMGPTFTIPSFGCNELQHHIQL